MCICIATNIFAVMSLLVQVDVIFEEDKSFWMAVNSFMQNAKCPIVLISTGKKTQYGQEPLIIINH